MRLVIALAIAWSSYAAADPATRLPHTVWRRDVLVSGNDHMCAIRGDRSVMCWGRNLAGEVGDPTLTAHPIPIIVPGVTDAVAIGASDTTSCAIVATHRVWCWGSGDPADQAPHAITGITDAAELALTASEACVRRSNGTVWCWRTTRDSGHDPRPIAGLERARRIVAGDDFICTIGEDGRVPCMMFRTSQPELAPLELVAARGAKQIAAASETAYAILPDGSVIGFELSAGVPTLEVFPVAGVAGAVDLEVSISTLCFARANGDASCGGTRLYSWQPFRPAPELRGVGALALAQGTSCSARANGEVVCWGDSYGALGRHDPNGAQPTPIEARGLGDAVELAVEHDETCARRADRSVACWAAPGEAPRHIAPLAPASHIVSGREFACAVDGGGAVACWGTVSWEPCRWDSPDNCQFERLDKPARVAGLLDVAGAVALADPCVLLGTGAVRCVYGVDMRSTTAYSVAGKARAISSRCFVDLQGGVACLDPAATTTKAGSLAVVPVRTLTPATAVVAGQDFACALLADATVACWGANAVGQLGDGTHTARATPVAVRGLARVVELTAGDAFACARTQTGEAWCWGANTAGALGDGSGRDHATPVRLKLRDVVELRASGERACARLRNGHAACWGHFFENIRDDVPASAAVRVADPDPQ